MRTFRIALLAFGCLGFSVASLAQTLPVNIQQNSTHYNLGKTNGLPISNTVNSPAGSDGRGPGPNPGPVSTVGQFQSAVTFGGLVTPQSANLNTNQSLVANAISVNLPRSTGNAVIMTSARVGAPFISISLAYLFGAVVSPPATDEYGVLLSTVNTNVTPNRAIFNPSDYWLAQPFTTNNHAGAGYYWSPHAQLVYAINPGPLTVVWQKAAASAPVGTLPSNVSTTAVNGVTYTIYTNYSVVSGSAVKTPQTIYWTEGVFRQTGHPVNVPAGLVGTVNVIYNSAFPQYVATQYQALGQVPVSTNLLPELRTLWYDQQLGQIYAYNKEGRVFVELLGDLREDKVTRVPLGFEIVDVVQQPTPSDVTVNLGERLTAYQDNAPDDSNLYPSPVLQVGTSFTYQQTVSGSDRPIFYATRETQNINDLPVHWLQPGLQGLLWPYHYVRYHLVWPSDVSAYEHYVRPLVATEAQAALTSVALPAQNSPVIDYQDPLDRPRAKLTSSFGFYTFLDPAHPAHRTLLRFTSQDNVAFSRVFSWLNANLKSGIFTNSVATQLASWNSTNNTFGWTPAMITPRVVSATVNVGDRIMAPSGELGSGTTNYLAGHIRPEYGTSFDPTAYLDPFIVGFNAADSGAIIPVNAIPGNNLLEVWWFRQSDANQASGFLPVYWPAVIGSYTLQWPASPSQIVLASNQGSGPLLSLQANGSIYYQNDSTLPGYNPNEEHAFMQGGQAWALRDDLNITSGTNYSSAPFVLLRYTESDSRPAMQVFQVVRESGNVRFNYSIAAGTVLQPPMPLPLMPKPLGPKFIGAPPRSLNHEVYFRTVASSLAVDATLTTVEAHHFRPWFRELALQSPDLLTVKWYFVTNVLYGSNLLQGVVSDNKPLSLTVSTNQPSANYQLIVTGSNLFTGINYQLTANTIARYGVPSLNGLAVNTSVYVISPSIGAAWQLPIVATDGNAMTIDVGLSATNVFTSSGALTTNSAAVLTALANLQASLPSTNDLQTASLLFIPSGALTDNEFSNWTLRSVPLPPARPANDSFVLQDRKGDLWVYRGPHNAGDQPSLGMQFYYPTLPGFFFPEDKNGAVLGVNGQPAVGTLTPYLRSSDNGVFAGDPIYGSADGVTDNNNALQINYNPVWPAQSPTLQMAETLTVPKRGLPAVRGQTSLEIVYQQSTIADTNNLSVRLHDPTRQKSFNLSTPGDLTVLGKIPDSVKTEASRGKTWFPLLPPHLVQRFWLDPNVGTNGALVFSGSFIQDPVGESYVLLNILSAKDQTTLQNLCLNTDPAYGRWTNAIASLQTAMQTFVENPQKPGTYIPAEGAPVDGPSDMAEVTNDDVAVDSYALTAVGPGTGYVTLIAGDGLAFTPQADPVSVLVFQVTDTLYPGQLKIVLPPNPLSELLTLQQVVDLAGQTANYQFDWRIAAPVDGLPPSLNKTNDPGSQWLPLDPAKYADGVRAVVGQSADVQALSDNYLIMRYRATNGNYSANSRNWSQWTDPALAEGWIKRVLAGINPFDQRVTDLFDNSVNTEVSELTQAGPRWEGNVALNQDSINNYGLIEIYETVLNRGRGLSIDAGINYGPANDALLLAASYISDLYMMLGNEAWADAANPTIGIGTKDNTYGDIATSLFSFQGEVDSLLAEEMALLEGRDDSLQPGVQLPPVYNRLYWNYTQGISDGEVIYALNYNILDQNNDGVIGAADAQIMYPQGHGDAYGHYLTALTCYYGLLLNSHFDWVPRIEAVNILGVPVSVGYLDERKFAAAAAAVARAGSQIFNLTWRRDYAAGLGNGWSSFNATRVNTSRAVPVTRYWGMDHWASRVGEGAYINWVVGNAILPAVDPDPTHEGIQKIDRTTVPELKELPTLAQSLQTSMDNAESGMNPLGLPQTTVPFDINPALVTGNTPTTHYEQIYDRATVALNNAVAAFDDAKDVTRLMRSEADSLADFQNTVDKQELSYTNQLIEVYGSPYPDDIGPGQTYVTGYAGPDLFHYMYVDLVELQSALLDPTTNTVFKIDTQGLVANWVNANGISDFNFIQPARTDGSLDYSAEYTNAITYNLGPHGFFDKPSTFVGKRASPGRAQQAISDIIKARNNAYEALHNSDDAKASLDQAISDLKMRIASHDYIESQKEIIAGLQQTVATVDLGFELFEKYTDATKTEAEGLTRAIENTLPTSLIAGLADGGDLTAPARGALEAAGVTLTSVTDWGEVVAYSLKAALDYSSETSERFIELNNIAPEEWNQELRDATSEMVDKIRAVQDSMTPINLKLQELDDAQRRYQSVIADGNRIQQEREVFRQRSAAVIQGYRTRDAAFRIFRNEKLDRYKSLFDLAAQYAFMAAQAYDYETGLLGGQQGKDFISRIIQSRSLGVVQNGQPQFGGSDTGDPGLSSAMAEMNGDWLVLKGRLGFNNPDGYGTTVSLRGENYRILPTSDGDSSWQDILNQGRMDNVLDDTDVRRYCLQIDPGNGLPVPGIVLSFSTVVNNGLNLFGNSLAAGDSAFSQSSFATKIFAVGVALEGYHGMNSPTAGGTPPPNPAGDPLALAATPYIYLIPVGSDSMRTPPLGDTSTIRVWNVDDVTVPLPFNIGGSDFSSQPAYVASDSLSEPMFAVRKHQAFRPVSSASQFTPDIYTGTSLSFSQFTNRRLIGRSVWNSKWKLIIPGYTLLNNPQQGLDRLVQSVKDIKLYFVTYSYSGN